MRKLFEIKEDNANLMELDADRYVNGETGEIISKEGFDALQMEYADKVEGVALGVKREDAMAKAIAEEIKALKSRMEYHEKRRDGYKQFLANELMGNKFETSKVRVGWRKSEVLEVDEGKNVLYFPEQYLKYKAPELNKALLKADIKGGAVFDGCRIVTKNNIQIK